MDGETDIFLDPSVKDFWKAPNFQDKESFKCISGITLRLNRNSEIKEKFLADNKLFYGVSAWELPNTKNIEELIEKKEHIISCMGKILDCEQYVNGSIPTINLDVFPEKGFKDKREWTPEIKDMVCGIFEETTKNYTYGKKYFLVIRSGLDTAASKYHDDIFNMEGESKITWKSVVSSKVLKHMKNYSSINRSKSIFSISLS